MSFERSVTAMLETINSQLDYLTVKVEAQVLKRATPANSTRVEGPRCVQSMPTGRDIPLDEPADYTVPLPWDETTEAEPLQRCQSTWRDR